MACKGQLRILFAPSLADRFNHHPPALQSLKLRVVRQRYNLLLVSPSSNYGIAKRLTQGAFLMAEPLTSVVTPRRARKLAGGVFDYVIEQIESAALKPGDKLPTEAKLMLTLGVSRTVVREGISRLQANKVIETRHGIGSFVLEPRREKLGIDMVPATTLRDVLSVLELRISLETECAGLAAQRAQPEDLVRMRAALDAIEATSRNGSDSGRIQPVVATSRNLEVLNGATAELELATNREANDAIAGQARCQSV